MYFQKFVWQSKTLFSFNWHNLFKMKIFKFRSESDILPLSVVWLIVYLSYAVKITNAVEDNGKSNSESIDKSQFNCTGGNLNDFYNKLFELQAHKRNKRSAEVGSLYDEYKKRLEKIVSLNSDNVLASPDLNSLLPGYCERKKRVNDITRNIYAGLNADLRKQKLKRRARRQKRLRRKHHRRFKNPAGFENGKEYHPKLDKLLSSNKDMGDGPILRRREAPILAGAADDSSSTYPFVLTKPLETSINTKIPIAASTLLNTVAKEMHMTPLELAKKLATASDASSLGSLKDNAKLNDLLKKYVASTVGAPRADRLTKQSELSKAAASCNTTTAPPTVTTQTSTTTEPRAQQSVSVSGNTTTCKPAQADSRNSTKDIAAKLPAPNSHKDEPVVKAEDAQCKIPANMSLILLKVLQKLEYVLEEKLENSNKTKVLEKVEGAPCNVVGSWSSYVMGLMFEIGLSVQATKNEQYNKTETKDTRKRKRYNKKNLRARASNEDDEATLDLCVEVAELVPPKPHGLVNPNWTFTGSALKQMGGPLLLLTERRHENIMATFSGFCRTCGGYDTLFGSWTFVFPSRDCEDITVAIEAKRDIMRRTRYIEKRRVPMRKIKRSKHKVRFRRNRKHRN